MRVRCAWRVASACMAALALLARDRSSGNAVAAGTVTITATVGSVSGQATVTVISGALTPGTVLWAAPQASGFTTWNMIEAEPSANGPGAYVLGSDSAGDVLLQAMTGDGRQLWQQVITAPNGSCCAATSDNTGGVLLNGSSLVDFDGATSSEKWQFSPQNGGGLSSSLAVGFDGTVYAIEGECVAGALISCLDSIDGTSGTLKSQVQLPADIGEANPPCWDQKIVNFGRQTPPVIGPDGQVYILSDSNHITPGQNGLCDMTFTETLSLLKNGTPYATLATYSVDDGGSRQQYFYFEPVSVIPDGNGGLLANFTTWAGGGAGILTIADTNGASASFPGFNMYPPADNMVLGDNNTAFMTDGTRVVSFNTTSLQTNWTYMSTNGLSLIKATFGSGVLIDDSQQGVIQLDATGTAGSPVAALQNAIPFNLLSSISDSATDLGSWGQVSSGVANIVAGQETDSASGYSTTTGALPSQRSAAAPAHPVNFKQVEGYPSPDGTGTLFFEYQWSSSTGKQSDLAACQVGEFVNYPSPDLTYTWPPPFVQQTANPTILGGSADNPYLKDHNWAPGNPPGAANGYAKPYLTKQFTAEQSFWWKCSYQSKDKINFFTSEPIPLARQTFYDSDHLWKYKAQKSNVTGIAILPVQ